MRKGVRKLQLVTHPCRRALITKNLSKTITRCYVTQNESKNKSTAPQLRTMDGQAKAIRAIKSALNQRDPTSFDLSVIFQKI